jgi:hypothetical protein
MQLRKHRPINKENIVRECENISEKERRKDDHNGEYGFGRRRSWHI